MPVYNCASFVTEAIKSLLQQSFGDFELLIIDDGSADNTGEVVDRFHDPRITLIRKEKNTGLVESLNLGIELAKGKFIARMDGDDICHTDRFSQQVNFLESNPDIELCATWYNKMETGVLVTSPTENDDIKIALIDNCVLAHPTIMMRKDFLDKYHLRYAAEFIAAEDYDLWTRIASLGKMATLPLNLLSYRAHQNQFTVKERLSIIKYSILCSVRMLCYPLSQVSESDRQIAARIVSNQNPVNKNSLGQLLAWLDALLKENKISRFYEPVKFDSYITAKKSLFVRHFYLHATVYNPTVLYQFIRSAGFRSFFSSAEYLKFIIKCLVYRNHKQKAQ